MFEAILVTFYRILVVFFIEFYFISKNNHYLSLVLKNRSKFNECKEFELYYFTANVQSEFLQNVSWFITRQNCPY